MRALWFLSLWCVGLAAVVAFAPAPRPGAQVELMCLLGISFIAACTAILSEDE